LYQVFQDAKSSHITPARFQISGLAGYPAPLIPFPSLHTLRYDFHKLSRADRDCWVSNCFGQDLSQSILAGCTRDRSIHLKAISYRMILAIKRLPDAQGHHTCYKNSVEPWVSCLHLALFVCPSSHLPWRTWSSNTIFLAYSTVTVSVADMHRRSIRTIIYLSL